MKVELPAGDHLHFLHNTGVAQLVRASVSKTEGRGFESYHPCKR